MFTHKVDYDKLWIMKVEFDKAQKENNVLRKLVLNVFVGDFQEILSSWLWMILENFIKCLTS